MIDLPGSVYSRAGPIGPELYFDTRGRTRKEADHETEEPMMNPEAWTILGVGVTLGGLIVTLGGLMWQMLRSMRQDMARRFGEIDKKFAEISENFGDVRQRLDRLASDHHSLARELSELRGELRGRLDERARPPPG